MYSYPRPRSWVSVLGEMFFYALVIAGIVWASLVLVFHQPTPQPPTVPLPTLSGKVLPASCTQYDATTLDPLNPPASQKVVVFYSCPTTK